MEKMALLLLSLMLFSTAAAASPPESIPDSRLRVTVQQKSNGKIVDGFHILELSCLNDKCALSTVSLNECVEAGGGMQAFTPRSEYASTSLGNLKVRNEGNTLVVQETGSDKIGVYEKNLRFEYEPAGNIRSVTRLTGFSGSYVKNSPVLHKVFALDYVPLLKGSQVMKLDCGVLLPGINK